MRPLTFQEFRAANVKRCLKWHPQGIESWSPSDWLTAVTGELGELASLLKMRNRERDGLPGNKFSPTKQQIADELADVLTYLDLLAEVLGVDLASAAVEKFNAISARVGFPDRIDLASPQAQEETRGAPAPAGLVWTKEKPTREGYYWVRCDSLTPSVVEIAEIAGVWYAFYTDQSEQHLRKFGEAYEWAGPIPEPAAPEAGAPGTPQPGRICTCLGSCKGAEGLAPGWTCALLPVVPPTQTQEGGSQP